MNLLQEPLFRANRVELLAAPVEPYDMLPLISQERYFCLLDGSRELTPISRYGFLCFDPFLVFQSKRSQSVLGRPGQLEKIAERPFEAIRTLLGKFRPTATSAEVSDVLPFFSGACGYLGYELLYEIESIPDLGRDDFSTPDSYLLFCQQMIAIDRQENKTWVVSTGYGPTEALAQKNADEKLAAALATTGQFKERRRGSSEEMRLELQRRRRAKLEERPRFTEQHLGQLGVRPVMTRPQYLELVKRAREHIFAGDIFEVCTSQRLDMTYERSSTDVYRVLRAINEAPFSALLQLDGLEVASASPERFMRLDRNGVAETRPIKGTRHRGQTPEEDKALFEDLQSCEKDSAENVMIVDLARNDLGRVCQFKTVEVPQLLKVESYAYTHQLVSMIRGRLRQGLDAVDLLKASFPGGSMTGAPKIEAMKIIDALEPVKRGIFSGSIGYLDFDGGFDLSIVIRTLVKKGDMMTLHVGGAIVADSDPAEEYQETLDKAHGLLTAIEFSLQDFLTQPK